MWPWELPPRARRIHQVENLLGFGIGTTSACAENTAAVSADWCGHGNYLRVRGEYTRLKTCLALGLELPPRARRIPLYYGVPEDEMGTTSACAENTGGGRRHSFHTGNYLRVRGEYLPYVGRRCASRELPPRARRIRDAIGWAWNNLRTTSACAENTAAGGEATCPNRNYLRVRGEYPRLSDP